MFDTQQEWVENKGEDKEEDKISTEKLVNAQSTKTQTAPVHVSANANVNVAIVDNQKDSVDKEEEVWVKEQTVENPQPVKDTTNEEETKKDMEAEKKTEKVEEERKMEEIKTSPEIPSESKLKKTVVDDDDDSVSIKFPINMDNLSSLELMKIATTMQSRA